MENNCEGLKRNEREKTRNVCKFGTLFSRRILYKPSSLTWISGGNFNNSSNCVVLKFLKGLEQKENIRISGKRKNPVRNERPLYFWGEKR